MSRGLSKPHLLTARSITQHLHSQSLAWLPSCAAQDAAHCVTLNEASPPSLSLAHQMGMTEDTRPGTAQGIVLPLSSAPEGPQRPRQPVGSLS